MTQPIHESITFVDDDTQSILSYKKEDNRRRLYALTISKHAKREYVTEGEIFETLKVLKERLNTLKVNMARYEIGGKYHQLHGHLIVTVGEFFKYKENNSINGFFLKWKPLNNIDGWVSYINKDVCNKYEQDEVFTLNHYRNTYSFVDTLA